jgi:hypothetical protein
MKQRIDETRNMLNTIRQIINEEESVEQPKVKGAIAITDDPKFGQQVLSSQIEEFKASVDGGAEFAAGNEESPEDSPLIYFPDNGNLTFSGRIRNIKWQFVLKDESGEGCYIWTDKLQLTHANMQVLNKLQGFFENWRANWQKEGASLEKLKNI